MPIKEEGKLKKSIAIKISISKIWPQKKIFSNMKNVKSWENQILNTALGTCREKKN